VASLSHTSSRTLTTPDTSLALPAFVPPDELINQIEQVNQQVIERSMNEIISGTMTNVLSTVLSKSAEQILLAGTRALQAMKFRLCNFQYLRHPYGQCTETAKRGSRYCWNHKSRGERADRLKEERAGHNKIIKQLRQRNPRKWTQARIVTIPESEEDAEPQRHIEPQEAEPQRNTAPDEVEMMNIDEEIDIVSEPTRK